jgi:2-dehydro-3-deoxygluconokinase
MIANEEDCQKCLGINLDVDVDAGEIDSSKYKKLADAVMEKYPIKALAVSLRESKSADINGWSGVLATKDSFSVSKKYEITDIVDRIGGGDSFGGSLIYGLRHFGTDYDKVINFAVAASALKHTIYGDFVRFTKYDVESLMGGSGSGRVQR